MNSTINRCLAGVLSVLGAGLVALPAGATAPQTSFAGTCKLSGTFSYETPVGWAPTTVRWENAAAGTCSGQVDGQQRTVQASVRERLSDDIGGCGPTSDAHGSGILTLRGAGQIPYTVDHPLVIGAAMILYGRGGGSARGIWTAYLRGTPASAEECTESRFVSQGFDEAFTTISTLAG
jgi:hypothetical protein